MATNSLMNTMISFAYTNPVGDVIVLPIVGEDVQTPALTVLALMDTNNTLPDGHMGECARRVLRGEPVYRLGARKSDGGNWDFWAENPSSDLVFTDEAFFEIVKPSDVLYALCNHLDTVSVSSPHPEFPELTVADRTFIDHPFKHNHTELFVIDVNAPDAMNLSESKKRFLEIMAEDDLWDTPDDAS